MADDPGRVLPLPDVVDLAFEANAATAHEEADLPIRDELVPFQRAARRRFDFRVGSDRHPGQADLQVVRQFGGAGRPVGRVAGRKLLGVAVDGARKRHAAAGDPNAHALETASRELSLDLFPCGPIVLASGHDIPSP